MSTLQIIIYTWLAFDVLVYLFMWFEHNKTFRDFSINLKKFLVEMNEDE